MTHAESMWVEKKGKLIVVCKVWSLRICPSVGFIDEISFDEEKYQLMSGLRKESMRFVNDFQEKI
jgi:hypothetical protein